MCHIALLEVMRNACKIVVGKPEGKRSNKRDGRKWEDSIKNVS
jgi:hypothetical protein